MKDSNTDGTILSITYSRRTSKPERTGATTPTLTSNQTRVLTLYKRTPAIPLSAIATLTNMSIHNCINILHLHL